MTFWMARLPFWSWGVWWRRQAAYEEPGHWQLGYWKITIHLGRVVVLVGHGRTPKSLRRKVEELVAECQDLRKTL